MGEFEVVMRPVCAAPGGGQRAMVSEDQLLDREEAIRGDDAEHLLEIDERGDTVLTPEQLPEEEEHEVLILMTFLPLIFQSAPLYARPL